ncbi:hypothetical protein D922_04076 [Enterococcus faecalis 06-MB-DW-09]|nr:hypothetical protein D922_04076 [Enterococcus faecalis 06-MB-DW-09]
MMQVKIRKLPVLFAVIILLTHLFLVPLRIVYAQTHIELTELQDIEKEIDDEFDFSFSENYWNDESNNEESLDFENQESEDAIEDTIEESDSKLDSTRTTWYVRGWDEFLVSYNDPSVTRIVLLTDIFGSTTPPIRTTDLVIDGNGFTIDLQNQTFRVGGENTTLTVQNTTILSQATSAFTTTDRVHSSNIQFVFSDIAFGGSGRFVSLHSGQSTLRMTVVFDGGVNSFSEPNSSNQLFVAVSEIHLKNNTTVISQGQIFSSGLANSIVELADSLTITIDKGSSLNIEDAAGSMSVANLNVFGEFFMYRESGTLIATSSSGSEPLKINVGSEANLKLERGRGNSLFGTSRDVIVSLAKGSNFDLLNSGGGRLFPAGRNVKLEMETENLALWDSGLQSSNEASIVFSDINLSLSGINGSVIDYTNNERFQELYGEDGVNYYSRISSMNVKEMDRYVTVFYLNDIGELLAEKEVITGLLGEEYQTTDKQFDHFSLIEPPLNNSGVFSRELTEVRYLYNPTIVSPVDPIDPEIEIEPENRPEIPENQRLFSIDFVSQFQFGIKVISVKEQTYYAKPQKLTNEDGTVNESEERPNYVQISDRRPENERNGWQLAVTQKEQFKNQTNQELTGARINLSNQQLVSAQGGEAPSLQVPNPLVLVPGNKRTLIRAEGTEGTGTWIYRFGDGETAGESVSLDVPTGVNPEATNYSTTLTWELSAVPGN